MYKSNEELDRIARGVISRTLPKSEWTHAAHFAAAIWLLENKSYDPFREMPEMIRRYNEATGVPNTKTSGYHETITIASLRATKVIMMAAPPDTPLFEITNTLLASEFGKSDWVLDYWHKETLFSPLARRKWVDPDKAQLPF